MLAPPIHCVPDDVLQEIFLRCLPVLAWRITLSPLEAPVLLSHVCHSWRQVSLALPQLWKTLRWDIQRVHVNEDALHTLVAAAARAKSAERQLQLLIRPRAWVKDKEKNDPFIPIPDVAKALLVPPVPTLTRLTLRGVPIAHIHGLPERSFPSLVDLVLHFEADLHRFPWEEKGPLKAFSDAPALRRLGIGASPAADYQRASHISNNIAFPMEQLTHILDFDTPEELSTMTFYLPQSRNLRYLFTELHERDVGLEAFVSRQGSHGAPLTLEVLECLTMNFWACGGGEISYPALFDAFEFPNIKALRIQGAELDFTDHTTWSPPLADRFLAKLFQLRHLTYLSLCPTSIATGTLHRILRATPNVTTLDAHIYQDYEYLLHVLTSGANDLLPELQELVLDLDNSVVDGSERDVVGAEALEAFLRTRMLLRSSKGNLFHRLVVYSADRQEMDEALPFVQVALAYAESRGLEFKRRLVEGGRTGKPNYLWLQRCPGLKDWPEIVEAHF